VDDGEKVGFGCATPIFFRRSAKVGVRNSVATVSDGWSVRRAGGAVVSHIFLMWRETK
jgi:hypothetical protein